MAIRYTFISKDEVTTCVLMHELGHSIGILKIDKKGNEISDTWKNYSSVMADLNINQFVLAQFLQYSPVYWKLRNMEYYII